MRIHRVKSNENFSAFLQQEAGYHTWHGYDYIEPSFVAEISQLQADFLSKATTELYAMCIAAVNKVITENRYKEFGIGALQAEHIRKSWQREQDKQDGTSRDPELYGRFDFCWNGTENLKFYEINADTPTTVYECAVVQWLIIQDLKRRKEIPENASQLNTLEQKVIAQMAHFKQYAQTRGITRLHFASMTDWKEDLTTTSYLEELAKTAGWETKFVDVGLIGANEDVSSADFGNLYDADNVKIDALYKLIPWEHMYESPYVQYIANDKIYFIEPPWKAILSNKMLSVILWEMYPNHPYLLPTYTSAESFHGTYVEKPIFGRISAGIKIVQNNIVTGSKRVDPTEPSGPYSRYPKIYQELCALPEMPGLPNWRYLTGMWVVGDGTVAGMDIRIDQTLITGAGTVKFLPHFVA